MRRLALALAIAGVFFSPGLAVGDDSEPLRVDLFWNAPSTGTPVVLWELEIAARVGQEPLPSYDPMVFPVDPDDPDAAAEPGSQQSVLLPDLRWDTVYEVRVRGFDAAGNAGPWSIWFPIHYIEPVDP